MNVDWYDTDTIFFEITNDSIAQEAATAFNGGQRMNHTSANEAAF